MKTEQEPGNNLNKEIRGTKIEKEKAVEEYILGTLFYTPQYYVKNQDYVKIMVYGAGESQPAMQIFRIIGRLSQLDSDPANLKEISFQDEVNVLKEGKAELMERWQINFSIFVDKESYEYKSIKEKPESVSHVAESVAVFNNLAKQKGAILYAGDWKFESDGNGWVPVNREGKIINQSELKSLMPALPAIKE